MISASNPEIYRYIVDFFFTPSQPRRSYQGENPRGDDPGTPVNPDVVDESRYILYLQYTPPPPPRRSPQHGVTDPTADGQPSLPTNYSRD